MYNLRAKLGKGFTLIELLVVVAIIGILASVVLVSLSAAKNKGADAAVKANLHTVINQAELFASDHGDKYWPTGGALVNGACPITYVESGTNMFESNKQMFDALKEAIKQGSGDYCFNSSSAWAVAVGLKADTSHSWCVDNSGVAKEVAHTPSTAISGAGVCID